MIARSDCTFSSSLLSGDKVCRSKYGCIAHPRLSFSGGMAEEARSPSIILFQCVDFVFRTFLP